MATSKQIAKAIPQYFTKLHGRPFKGVVKILKYDRIGVTIGNGRLFGFWDSRRIAKLVKKAGGDVSGMSMFGSQEALFSNKVWEYLMKAEGITVSENLLSDILDGKNIRDVLLDCG